MALRSSGAGLVRRLAFIGVAETDTDDIRVQKAALTLAAALITALSIVWVGTYWVLGLARAAAIPFVYQIASVASIVLFARTKGYRFFRLSQAVMMTLLPFLLQWTLGGYVASSAVSLWALVAAIGTLFFFTADESIPWFVDGRLQDSRWQAAVVAAVDLLEIGPQKTCRRMAPSVMPE